MRLQFDRCRAVRKVPVPPAPEKEWEVLHMGKRATRIGVVNAADERKALQKAIEEFDIAPRDVPRTLVRPR